MTIDAHQHFWHYDPERHGWITDEMAVLKRDFLPDDLLPIYHRHGIDGCVAVQAESSTAETDFLLALSQQYDFIKGVVGWIDLCAHNIEAQLQLYLDIPKLCGFRHIVQDEPDPDFLLRSDFQRGLSMLARYGFTYDMLIYPQQMPAALKTIERLPGLRMVIDHIAKPNIKQGHAPGWVEHIRAIAEHPQVYCKISGMITEADWAGWRYDDMIPWLDIVFDAFGTDRLMFGSDWPVCLLAGKYREVKEMLERYTESLSPQEREKIWGHNALDFYRLK